MTPDAPPPTAAWWFPALRECERAAVSVPDWAELAERAFARADAAGESLADPDQNIAGPDQNVAGAGDPDENVARTGSAQPSDERAAAEAHFVPVVASLVAVATEELELDADVAPSVLAGLRNELAGTLARTAARCLVAELHRQLAGQGGRAEFVAALRRLAGGAGLRELAARYPVLFRLLASQAAGRVAAFREMLARYLQDRPAIVEELLDGRDPGRLVEVRSGLGDTHHHGRSVCVLGFADGRQLVYKPRSLAVHHAMHRILRLLDADLRLDLRTAPVLCRAGYGWMAFVEAAGCTDAGEVADYFRRQGALLAVLHGLRATDLHCENLIAAGAQPILLDLETVAHPDLVWVRSITDPALRGLNRSVLRTAMLPRPGAGPDLSGFGGAPGTVPEAVGYADAGLPSMHLVRRPRPYPGAPNRPLLDGNRVGPIGYLAEVTAGFRLGYDALLRQAAELLAPGGPIEELSGLPARVVLRNTKMYARLLDECTHPDVLSDAVARERVLCQLAEHGQLTDPRLLASEVTQLWHGDVPIFQTRPGRPGVWSVDDSEPVLTEIEPVHLPSVIGRLDAADRERQVWLIEAALLSTTEPAAVARPDERAEQVAAVDLVTAAMVVGDRLIADAFDDGERCNWVTVYRHPAGGASVLPMGLELGQGYLGVSLFLAQLAEVGGASRHRDGARRGLAEVDFRLAMLADHPQAAELVGPGAFSGLGGVLYALHQLSVLDAGAVSADALPNALQLLERAADHPDPSVATGRAGGLLALLNLHAAGYPDIAERAERWAEQLAGSPAESAGAGLFFGQLGIAWALARAGRLLERPDLASNAAALLGRLPDGRQSSIAVPDGLGGLALVWQELDPDSFTARRTHRQLVEAGSATSDDSLAGGWLGVADVALRGPAGLPSRLAERMARLAAATSHGHPAPRCGVPGGLAVPSLLYGLAGIGHALLRLHDPAAVPSVLALDGARSAGPRPASKPDPPDEAASLTCARN